MKLEITQEHHPEHADATSGPWLVADAGTGQMLAMAPTEESARSMAEILMLRAELAAVRKAADSLAEHARSVDEQIRGVGVEDWAGAEGLDFAGLRLALAAYDATREGA